jgi:hypothetical protein
MAGQDQSDEIAKLKARIAELEATKKNDLGSVGFSRGFFGCFGVAAAIVAVIIGAISIGQCSRTPSDTVSSNPPTDTSSGDAKTAAPAVQAAPEQIWKYTETTDELTGKPTKTACTTSTNEVHLEPPYESVTADFCIRNSAKFGIDAYINLNGSGQILCSSYEGCTVKASFDKGPVKAFPGAEAADHSSNIIFINNTNRLIAEVKKSETVVIELRFYQAGVQDLTFKTEGLKWPPQNSPAK